MSILIKGMDMPKCSNEDIVVVIRHNGNAEVWQTGCKEQTVEAEQMPDSLVSWWEDYKERLKILNKVGRKTFAHKIFEVD